jgi:4-hydroxy-tetrahydrodipicolinate synthase
MLPGDPEELRARIPAGRLGRPEEVADLAAAVLRNAYLTNLVALGTTGEHAALTPAERNAVVGTCARICREHGAALIVGAGLNDTAGTARALQELAAWPEVSAALTVVPYYTRPSEEGVLAHFTRLAADSPVPLVVYNVPYRTGRVLSGQTLLRLAGVPRIIGIKHAVGAIDGDTITLLAGRPGDFAVLGGDDLFISPLLALGADGGILASAHVCAGEFARLIAAWRTGHAEQARALGHRLAPLSAALFAEPNPAVIKGVLHARGKITSPAVRLPLLPARQDAIRAATALLGQLQARP